MRRDIRKKRSAMSDETSEDPAQDSIFQRLFAPASVDTSVSSDSGDDGSAGSETQGSTASESSFDSDGDSSANSGRGLKQFDRELRAKHRGACKNMTLGKYGKAIKTFEGILADILDRFGEEHHRVGAALHNVAVANLRAGHLRDARDAIEEAVRIRKVALGDHHPKVTDSLVEHGIVLLSMKRYNESLNIFEEALGFREREARSAKKMQKSQRAQEAQLKIAKIKHNIGCVNFELGKLDRAKKAYSEAIEQQKAAFGTWSTPFMLLTDTTKPGFLTMASTMCNKGYIDLEQDNFRDAIVVFLESLKIQKVLLDADNKLILSTLDNIGYAYCRLAEFENAARVYNELVKLQKESYGDKTQKGWSHSMKRLVFCQVKLYDFETAFDNLRLLEVYLSTKGAKMRNADDDLEMAHALMGAANYQIFKFPTIAEYTSRACGMCGDDRDGIDVDPWFPTKPANGSKMSGHRMTYA